MVRTGFSKVEQMPDTNFDERLEGGNPQMDSAEVQSLSGNEDLVMEQILENINTTPIGQVLKKIASLPEIRQEKVLDVRQRLTAGEYEISERLDVALDKVLEDLTT